jgi:hypothetical protein
MTSFFGGGASGIDGIGLGLPRLDLAVLDLIDSAAPVAESPPPPQAANAATDKTPPASASHFTAS